MMDGYFQRELQARVERRARPLQYLLLHIFLMVSFLILLGVGEDLGFVSENQITILSILAVISLIGHIFWRGSQSIQEKILRDEEERLNEELTREKLKRGRLILTDEGEIAYYEDEESGAQQIRR